MNDNQKISNVFPRPDEFDKIQRLGGFKMSNRSCRDEYPEQCLSCGYSFMTNNTLEVKGLKQYFCSDCISHHNENFLTTLISQKKSPIESVKNKIKDSYKNGRIEPYVHSDSLTKNKGGVLVKIACETDFAAKTAEFVEFCKATARLCYAIDISGPVLDYESYIMEIDPNFLIRKQELEKKLKEKIEIINIVKMTL